MFNGNCEAAFKFYEHCLGKIVMLDPGCTSAEHVPAGWHDKIMHVCLDLERLLMGSDESAWVF